MDITVILLMALTADGKIGRDAHHFVDWSGKADKQVFVKVSKQAGCMIMGRKTYETIGRPLPGRKTIVLTRNPDLVQNLPGASHPDLEFTSESPKALLKRLARNGYQQVVLAGGAAVNTLFAEQKLVDEILLTISPIIFGQGLSLFSGVLEMSLGLMAVERLEDDSVFLRYKVLK